MICKTWVKIFKYFIKYEKELDNINKFAQYFI
jgi:hypothetical protein